MKAWPTLGILIVESILLAGHWFVYRTWIVFHGNIPPADSPWLFELMLALSFSYMAAALISFRFSNSAVRVFYKLASLWLGFLHFLFWASCLTWLVWLVVGYSGLIADPASARPWIVGILFSLAILAGLYGLVNARVIRVRHIHLKLAGLPEQWRGRRAVLLSDLHLGNINGARFCRRVAMMAARFKPDVVFLPGDLFDGTRADLDALTEPLEELAPPLGIFYSTGNHEEFTSPLHYVGAVTRRGLRNLDNESVDVDGLQVAGVTWGHSTYPIHMKSALDGMKIDRERASVLLNHSPSRLPLVERAGFKLQLSGHTHGGQIAPFTWLTRRIFGKFTYGLHNFGALQVYTSTGVGTWGPPMRVGTHSEIVVLQFE
ncbi:MAG TPA: metallophosphoesterase [Terracidiphilus sp.]